MRIKKLTLNNFKNYEVLNLRLSNPINCLVGSNGSGKTNILDSIYYLLLTKSFLNTDSQLIKHNESYAVSSMVIENGKEYFISSKLENGKRKQFNLNKEPYKKTQDHIGKFPVVIISPYDTNLIHGGSEMRRKFFDGIMAQFDAFFLDNLLKYNKLLKHRNALLKQYASEKRIDHNLLKSIDEQLFPMGEIVCKTRKTFFEKFYPVFQENYKRISGEQENVSITYQTFFEKEDLKSLFELNKDKDLITGRTHAGPHKDDYTFEIEENPLSKFGSQGQQKSFVMALKFTNYTVLEEEKQAKPILLLDDIFDRIDEERISQFVEMIENEKFGQIFVTDTHLDRIQNLFQPFQDKMSIFKIQNGSLIDELKT